MRSSICVFAVVLIFFNTLHCMEELNSLDALPGQHISFDSLRHNYYSSPMTSQVLGIVSLLMLLNKLTQTTRSGEGANTLFARIYQGDMSELLTLVRQMFVLGCVSYTLKLSWDVCAYGATHVSQIYRAACSNMSSALDFIFRRGAPFDAQYLHILEQVFESIAATLSDQTVSGNLMLRNFRADEQDDDEAQEVNWQYFVTFTTESFEHITAYIRAHLTYYQRKRIGMFGTVCARSSGVIFTARTIIKNLEHIMRVCKRACHRDEVDVHHTRQIAQNTLLLFRKLRALVRGNLASDEFHSERSFAQAMT